MSCSPTWEQAFPPLYINETEILKPSIYVWHKQTTYSLPIIPTNVPSAWKPPSTSLSSQHSVNIINTHSL